MEGCLQKRRSGAGGRGEESSCRGAGMGAGMGAAESHVRELVLSVSGRRAQCKGPADSGPGRAAAASRAADGAMGAGQVTRRRWLPGATQTRGRGGVSGPPGDRPEPRASSRSPPSRRVAAQASQEAIC